MSERLYGNPGAEQMHRTAEDAYEAEIGLDGALDAPDPGGTYVIEEWSVRRPRTHAPRTDLILSWIVDNITDEGEVDEHVSNQWENAAEDPQVVAAFDAALDLMASKVSYRMADRHLRDLTVTYGTNGDPLLDGEPMYPGEPT